MKEIPVKELTDTELMMEALAVLLEGAFDRKRVGETRLLRVYRVHDELIDRVEDHVGRNPFTSLK